MANSYVYILKCNDNSYYLGSTRCWITILAAFEWRRMWLHCRKNSGYFSLCRNFYKNRLRIWQRASNKKMIKKKEGSINQWRNTRIKSSFKKAYSKQKSLIELVLPHT